MIECQRDHNPSSGFGLLASDYWFWDTTLRSTHASCEGPHTIKDTMIFHLRLGLLFLNDEPHHNPLLRPQLVVASMIPPLSLDDSLRLSISFPRPVLFSTTREGLHGSPSLYRCEPQAGRPTVVQFTVREPFHGSLNYLIYFGKCPI